MNWIKIQKKFNISYHESTKILSEFEENKLIIIENHIVRVNILIDSTRRKIYNLIREYPGIFVNQIRKSFGSILGLGLLSIIIYIGVVIFSALLCFLLIGIPLLVFFVILGIVIQIFGRVVLFFFLGESLIKAFGKSKISPIIAAVIGLVLVTIIRFIPVIGFLFSLCLSILGWGVVIKTKFGTTENWFRKRMKTIRFHLIYLAGRVQSKGRSIIIKIKESDFLSECRRKVGELKWIPI